MNDVNEPDEFHEKVLTQLDVKLNHGKTDVLTIFNDEDIQKKISQFCQQHNLDKKTNIDLLNKVMSQIDDKMAQIKRSNRTCKSSLYGSCAPTKRARNFPAAQSENFNFRNIRAFPVRTQCEKNVTDLPKMTISFSRDKTKSKSKNKSRDHSNRRERQIKKRISRNEANSKDLKTGRRLFKSTSQDKENKNRKDDKNLFTINEQKISRDIIFKMKIIKYREIFNQLDSDKNGLISVKKMRLCFLDHELLQALTPVFEDLQKDINKEMNFKEFCIKADKYLTVILSAA